MFYRELTAYQGNMSPSRAYESLAKSNLSAHGVESSLGILDSRGRGREVSFKSGLQSKSASDDRRLTFTDAVT